MTMLARSETACRPRIKQLPQRSPLSQLSHRQHSPLARLRPAGGLPCRGQQWQHTPAAVLALARAQRCAAGRARSQSEKTHSPGAPSTGAGIGSSISSGRQPTSADDSTWCSGAIMGAAAAAVLWVAVAFPSETLAAGTEVEVRPMRCARPAATGPYHV